ncbi:FtsK/SpoIIIE domain-containing protein [Rathayibacter iranicus]|uniref:Cell division protein FtsK n=2 Tax=Rathayibacter iranicus TaxID=59737 RepID=A0AAD1ELQ0_9MICO|nr:FtsK/SpoIIIE domain-containing protein [Rathayibacter iranicus]AZZ54900.1 cell division protein FtsK [Rathayibacter iranicus]MWV31480.1 cell division protein FtsK [Rathayibacter iranicus NCPPB 2253 = VKM Ac-1602]PPI62523.1 cell division protein FtsK [Rathayibacter iranicus]PWJ61015.1 FtsK/SpoIIIE family protein [Rathayibacter iranicus NCPPB 2253 = VKM Ac-1602]
MATERISIKPGTGFDANNKAHIEAVLTKVAKTDAGTGWSMQSHDPETGTLTLTRQSAVTQVSKSKERGSYDVGLRSGTKPADGDQVAAHLESDPRHRGYVMTKFEPFLGTATLSKLSADAQRCRGAVAVALGVKAWDVQVTNRPDGGFSLGLPRIYVPSKHDAKLTEVAEQVVGRDGWYVQVQAQALTAEIIPSEPPTFPTAIGYPLERLPTVSRERTPFGVKLPEPGSDTLEEVCIDWSTQAFAMIAGTPGSGKSVTLNALIAGSLAAGTELVICDIFDKRMDFTWMKEWCRDGGWGAEGDVESLAALSLVYEEGKRRSEIIERYGVTNWTELPREAALNPILVIVDEVSGLLVTEKLPAGVPKDNPIVVAKTMRNLIRVSIEDVISRTLAEQRAFGIRMILASQVTNANTGIGPSQKAKIGHKILQGSNPSKTARTQAFNSEAAAPLVPGNVRADVTVAKGVGVAELEGQDPFVYKTYYAGVEDYRRALNALNIPKSTRPEPTAADIARFDPSGEAEMDSSPSRLADEAVGYGRGSKPPRDESGLTGAAAAAHQLKVAEQAVKRTAAVAA